MNQRFELNRIFFATSATCPIQKKNWELNTTSFVKGKPTKVILYNVIESHAWSIYDLCILSDNNDNFPKVFNDLARSSHEWVHSTVKSCGLKLLCDRITGRLFALHEQWKLLKVLDDEGLEMSGRTSLLIAFENCTWHK